jgi:two-component system CheB/CheR fusion protein
MKKIPIVGIGASVGSLLELERFFRHMPSGLEVAFVIIQHQHPSNAPEGIQPDVMTEWIEMVASHVDDKMEVEAGKVYMAPPHAFVTIDKGRLRLMDMPADSRRHLPLDVFFRSLRDNLGEKAVGIILSGTGSDGALGIKAVKEAGGLTLAQDPATTEYAIRPLSAIRTGLIDFVIPVEEMPEVILNHIGQTFDGQKRLKATDSQTARLILEIFDLIRAQTGHDFSKYKTHTIYRRVERRIAVNKRDTLPDYVALLREDPDEIRILYKELLISVTCFFRDSETFKVIAERIIPRVISTLKTEHVRVWVPACATGEEAYTWVMLLKEYIDAKHVNIDVQVIASDIDTDALDMGRKGLYPSNIAVDVPPHILDTYFDQEKDGFRVKKAIREKVIFADQNLLQDPPYSTLDIISCRNLLIYLNEELQHEAISLFHYALNPKGVLLLGNSESLGSLQQHFKIIDRSHNVFEKQVASERLVSGQKIPFLRPRKDVHPANLIEKPISELTRDFILERHTPPGVVIDYEGDMHYVQGQTGKFLTISTCKLGTELVKVAREGLQVPLANAIHKAKRIKGEVLHRNVRVKNDEGYTFTDLLVAPLHGGSTDIKLLIVLFQPVDLQALLLSKEEQASPAIQKLEQELVEKERYLQSLVSEPETAIEEPVKAKDEAHFVNQELATSNVDLIHKVEELDSANTRLANLLLATESAALFLDKELRITHFTTSISSIIDLRPTDIGRPIQQFTHKLAYDHLLEDSQEVLKSLVPKQAEILTANQRHFWLRILPYRTVSDTIEGLVVTFTDMTQYKQQEVELEKYRHHLALLIQEKSQKLRESEALLNTMGRIAQIGGWKFEVATQEVAWTREVYRIHEVPNGFVPDLGSAYAFYEESSRPNHPGGPGKSLHRGHPL